MVLLGFTTILATAAGVRSLQAVLIISGTFVLEDAATLLTAMQVASGALSLPVALGSLYAGIVLGDLGLYGLGRLSATHGWAKKLVPQHRQDLGRNWVKRKVIPLVLVSRFVPGLRLPTYTTLGFLRAPFLHFALAVPQLGSCSTTPMSLLSPRSAEVTRLWRARSVSPVFMPVAPK